MIPRDQIAHSKAMKMTILDCFSTFGDHAFPLYKLGRSGIAFHSDQDLDRYISRIDFDEDFMEIAKSITSHISGQGAFISDYEIYTMFIARLRDVMEQMDKLSDDAIDSGLTDALDL